MNIHNVLQVGGQLLVYCTRALQCHVPTFNLLTPQQLNVTGSRLYGQGLHIYMQVQAMNDVIIVSSSWVSCMQHPLSIIY